MGLNNPWVFTNEIAVDFLGRRNFPQIKQKIRRCHGFLHIGRPCQAVESVFIGSVGHFLFIEIQCLTEKLFPIKDFSQGQSGGRDLGGGRALSCGRPVEDFPVPPFRLGPVSGLEGHIPHTVEGPHGQLRGAFPVGFNQPCQGLNAVLRGCFGGIGQVDINDLFNGKIRPPGVRVFCDDGKIGRCHCRNPAHTAALPGLLKQGFRFQIRHQIRHHLGLIQKLNGFFKRCGILSQIPQKPGLGHQCPCPDMG